MIGKPSWLFAKGIVIGGCGAIAMIGAAEHPMTIIGLVVGYLAMTVVELTRTPADGVARPAATDTLRERWLAFIADRGPDWSAARDVAVELNHLVRDGLRAAVDADRVRLFAITPTGQALSLGGGGAPGPDHSSPALRELIDGGANSLTPTPTGGFRWRIGVRCSDRMIGAIEAHTRHGLISDAERRELEAQLALLWRGAHAEAERRRHMNHDGSTGVLGRQAFLERGEIALRAAGAREEPVVLACVSIEGLRGLDDRGALRHRDEWVEAIGRALGAGLRGDDLIGRLADDRFGVLLARTDERLGLVVARKLVEACAAATADIASDAAPALRVGITSCPAVGADLSLEDLLTRAMRAVESARRSKTPIAKAGEGRS